MKVFVTGATGVLGRRVVDLLLRGGHEVTALVDTASQDVRVRSWGATPVAVSLFDAGALTGAMLGHDAVANLATAVPEGGRAWRTKAWAENDRVHTDGARAVVDAALAAGVSVVVQTSTALNYPSWGGWSDESTPLDPIPQGRSALAAEAEGGRFTAAGRRGVVLRFGLFYGPEGQPTDAVVRLLRMQVAPGFGPEGKVPAIHIDDAAAAAVAALTAPAGVWNVTDDTPLRRAAFYGSASAAMGLRPPRVAPLWAAPLGGLLAPSLSRSQAVSNRRFRHATGWSPRYPDATSGWPAALRDVGPPPAAARRNRILLALLAVGFAVVGLWAQFAPRSFYDGFPGFGRVWVAVDGPYNEHLTRDVGALNLALMAVAAAAAVTLTVTLVRVAAGAALLYGTAHFVYHLLRLDAFATTDATALVVALGFGVAAPAALLSAAGSLRRR